MPHDLSRRDFVLLLIARFFQLGAQVEEVGLPMSLAPISKGGGPSVGADDGMDFDDDLAALLGRYVVVRLCLSVLAPYFFSLFTQRPRAV